MIVISLVRFILNFPSNYTETLNAEVGFIALFTIHHSSFSFHPHHSKNWYECLYETLKNSSRIRVESILRH
jgi:hypothetical protein